jgi:hypothetical protein
MPAETSRREGLDEALVRVAVRVNAWLSTLLRPGSFAIFVVASLSGVGAVMKQADLPSKNIWDAGSPALIALVILGAITYLGYVLVVWGYRCTLKARDEEGQLYRACRDVAAALVVKTTTLDRDSVGVQVWVVRGLRGMKRLERRATFVPWDRPPTAIVWRKGKGAIGKCWSQDRWVLADLEELQALAPTEEAFFSLPPERRFFFKWPEFTSTDHYRGVLAWPLHGGPEAAPRVVGCLSIDVQEPAAAAQLDAFRTTQRDLFGEHLAVCEAVLRGK